jgi:hypothetical protein
MRRRTFLGGLIGAGIGYHILPARAIGPFGQTRIAWTCDGNYHDKDDWGAAPMAVALLGDSGDGYRLVHYDFNSNMLNSLFNWEQQMRKSIFGDATTNGASERWNVAPRFYDDRPNPNLAVANLNKEIMASSSINKLIVCLGGPAEILWRALQGVPNTIRQHVRVISHSSSFNENTGPHTLAQCTGVVVERIPNQNQRLNTKQNWSPWNWLKTSGENNKFLWDRMRASGRADVSDSGMMYYVLYGNKTPTPTDYRNKLA